MAGVASASPQAPQERGFPTAVTVSIQDERLRLVYSEGFTGPEVSVDYDSALDDWVATGPAVVAGAECDVVGEAVQCPEDGEDVSVNFNNTPGEVTLQPADDDLNFATRARLGSSDQAITTSNGRDVITSDDADPPSSTGDEIATLGGRDSITGGSSPDLIYGGRGNDTISGTGGDDILHGGSEGGTGPDGADSFEGGEGVDLVSYGARTDDVSARIGGAGGAPDEGDAIAEDVEDLTGGLGNDVLVGDAGANTLRGGGDGDDLLLGGGGAGPDGADLFRGGSGVSTNIDTVSYARRTDAITADIGGGTNDVDGDDISADTDVLIGGKAGDNLTGDDDANTIVGGKGQDTMLALGGADTINALDDGPDTSDCGDGVDVARTDVAQTEVVTACESIDSAPETEITLRPEPTITTTRARFRFESPTSGVTGFECSLDGAAFTACTSPFVAEDLALGEHRFAVRAIDGDGDPDISPAIARFRRVEP